MNLQNDGYYVCSKCKYRVKSPELEDKDILSSDDYLCLVSCEMFYSHLEILEKTTRNIDSEITRKNILEQMMTRIRQEPEYLGKYSFSDLEGKCAGPTIDYDEFNSTITLNELNVGSIGNYNGLYEAIHELIIGYYCPTISLSQSITDLITHQMNALDFSALVLDEFGHKKFALGLSIASESIQVLNSGITLEDRAIIVSANRYEGHFVISPEGDFKFVKYKFYGT